MKNTTEATAEELQALLTALAPPTMREKLADFELEDGGIRGRYKGIPIELELRITPKG